MKNKITILLPIIGIVSLSLPVFILYQYFHNVSNGEFSTTNSDWGDFGSILSGSFTLLSSIATLSTLWFVIYQHNKNIEHQKNVFDQQEELAREQKEIIRFQKYQTHRELFQDLLTSIESKFDHKIKFHDTHSLYCKIFPNNNFDKCDYVIDLTDNESSILNDFVRIAESLNKNISSDAPAFESIIFDIIRLLLDKMNLTYSNNTDEHTNGDVYITESNELITNIFSIKNSIFIIESVAQSLTEFTGNKFNIKLSHNADSSFILNSSLKAAFRHRLNNDLYRIHINIKGLDKLITVFEMCQLNNHRIEHREYCDSFYINFIEWYRLKFENLKQKDQHLEAIFMAKDAVDKMKVVALPPTRWQYNFNLQLENTATYLDKLSNEIIFT